MNKIRKTKEVLLFFGDRVWSGSYWVLRGLHKKVEPGAKVTVVDTYGTDRLLLKSRTHGFTWACKSSLVPEEGT